MPPEPTSERQEEAAPAERACFRVGEHLVRLRCAKGRWSADVDATPLEQSYATEVDAWTAGVREADRLDRLAKG